MKTAEQIANDQITLNYEDQGAPEECPATENLNYLLQHGEVDADGIRAMLVAAIEADRAQRELKEEPIYWDEADDDQPETHAFGADTAQIVDEEQGGAIAYCHRDNANEIVKALLAYRKEWA